MGEPEQIVSYAHRDLTRKEIVKYARQYEGIDMAELMGADEENFPFVIEGEDIAASTKKHGLDDQGNVEASMKRGEFSQVCVWNVYNGIMAMLDDDPVRRFATIEYLREHAYPIFKSYQDAEQYAKEHAWPRKAR